MLTTEFHRAEEPDSRRLLIALHGLGDSLMGYRWLPAELALPSMNCLLVNAPDPYYGGFSWYDFENAPGPGIERSRKLLFSLLDQQRAEGWPADQITLFGFSQGCLMTWEIGFHYPHRLAGIVGVSGYVNEVPASLSQLSPVATKQRFLITHGTMDPLLPFEAARDQVRKIQTLGLDVQWQEFIKPHTIAGREELNLIRKFIRAGYK